MDEAVRRGDDGTPEYPEYQEFSERRREPIFNLPGVILLLIGICTAVQAFRLYVLDPRQDMEFMLDYAFIPLRYTGPYALDFYAFISPVTYAFLHGGWTHLFVNMIWLAAFGSPLANRMGVWRFLLFWIFTALVAALFHFLAHMGGNMPVVGASGAISGMMGAASRFGFRMGRLDGRPAFAGPMLSIGQALMSRTVVVFLAVWFVVNLVAGMGWISPGIDSPIAWQAHIGGFLAGFFCAAFFAPPTYPLLPSEEATPDDPLESHPLEKDGH
ncbi:MAG: rhomboid family intramembrane serine protease [Rhizobiaceae bacterium]